MKLFDELVPTAKLAFAKLKLHFYLFIYSCFEKGCPKVMEDPGGSWSLIEAFGCFSGIEGNSTNKCICVFFFLVGKHREPQSINAKLFLPIIPIYIVAHAFTLLWDNFCRNSCIISFLTNIYKHFGHRNTMKEMPNSE